jgi:hypothetical protein
MSHRDGGTDPDPFRVTAIRVAGRPSYSTDEQIEIGLAEFGSILERLDDLTVHRACAAVQ